MELSEVKLCFPMAYLGTSFRQPPDSSGEETVGRRTVFKGFLSTSMTLISKEGTRPSANVEPTRGSGFRGELPFRTWFHVTWAEAVSFPLGFDRVLLQVEKTLDELLNKSNLTKRVPPSDWPFPLEIEAVSQRLLWLN